MLFRDLNLINPILSALEAEGYVTPTPVQAAAIKPILEGRDLIACAQTGTGKTAGFALPILQILAGKPAAAPGPKRVRALVLSPTRELALQIAESFEAYGRNLNLRMAVVFGGVSDLPQKNKLRQGVDILVATPGRLLDLLGQQAVSLGQVEIFTLDEADRMLDMGFIHDVRRITALLPKDRQTLLFSATMPDEIRHLSSSMMRNPARVEVAAISSTADNIDQGVYFVARSSKATLLRQLLADAAISRVLVFTRTKHGADRVRKSLESHLIPAEAIHGNKSQNARQRSLSNFKDGSARVLVATDVAARGIDIDDISHVVNYDLPDVPETYVHRIGRTARAGASGISLSFCDSEERGLLKDIERLIKNPIRVLATPVLVDTAPPAGSGAGRDEARGDSRRSNDSGRRQDSGRSRTGQSSGQRSGQASGQRQSSGNAIASSNRGRGDSAGRSGPSQGSRNGGSSGNRRGGSGGPRPDKTWDRQYFTNDR